LSRRIVVTATRDNVFSISFQDTDPKRARAVVQGLLNTFVADTLKFKQSDANNAQNFLVNQLREYEQRLRTSEYELAEFKKKNLGLLPGDSGDYYTRLQTSLAALDDLHAKYKLADDKRTELRRQLDGEEPTFGIMTTTGKATSDPYEARIAELQARID